MAGVALQAGGTSPEWVQPLEKLLPELAGAVKAALTAAAAEQERLQPSTAQKGKLGAKAAPAPTRKPDPKVGAQAWLHVRAYDR